MESILASHRYELGQVWINLLQLRNSSAAEIASVTLPFPDAGPRMGARLQLNEVASLTAATGVRTGHFPSRAVVVTPDSGPSVTCTAIAASWTLARTHRPRADRPPDSATRSFSTNRSGVDSLVTPASPYQTVRPALRVLRTGEWMMGRGRPSMTGGTPPEEDHPF